MRCLRWRPSDHDVHLACAGDDPARPAFYTPATAQAMLSWRLAVGTAAAIVAVLFGVHWGVALLIGLAVYAVLVWQAMPRATTTDVHRPVHRRRAVAPAGPGIAARRATDPRDGLHDDDGPLKERLASIVTRLDQGIERGVDDRPARRPDRRRRAPPRPDRAAVEVDHAREAARGASRRTTSPRRWRRCAPSSSRPTG